MEQLNLQIYLLGPLRILAGGKYLPLHISGVTKDILGYLLFKSRSPIRREALASLFFPESTTERSKSAMNTAIWRIRKCILPIKEFTLHTDNDLIVLNYKDNLFTDVESLSAIVRQSQIERNDSGKIPSAIRRELRESLSESQGLFMEGCDAYWALVERERLQNAYVTGLSYLMDDAFLRKDYDDGLVCGDQILKSDPSRESIYHFMMVLNLLSGRRTKAILYYEKLRAYLYHELGLSPSLETQKLREIILSEQRNLYASNPDVLMFSQIDMVV